MVKINVESPIKLRMPTEERIPISPDTVDLQESSSENKSTQLLRPYSFQSGNSQSPNGATEEANLLQNETEKQWIQNQQVHKVPWRGIALAVTLLLFGLTFFGFGALLLAQILRFESLDGLTPYGLLIFGLLCIIPGAYHIRNAIFASCGHSNYSWDDIPNFD